MTTQYRRFTASATAPASEPHTDIAGIDACLKERRRFVAALERGDKSHARRRLVRGYLPALAELSTRVDMHDVERHIARLAERLDRGLMYVGPEQARADDLFDELLAEYEVLSDMLNLAHGGTPQHPAWYLMERVLLRCR